MADAVYTVTCPQSGVSVVAGCACEQVGHDPLAAGAHHERCRMNNLTANLSCPESAGCCQQDHDHEAAANACPGGHGACPEPSTCRLNESVKAHHLAMRQAWDAEFGHLDPAALPDQALGHAIYLAADPPDACPGGHCHKDIPGCTVCHPVIITAGVGTAVLRPVTA